ncbi:MAG: FAD-dependent oxidoreductase [Acidimicrobiales bacterium]
MPERQGAAVPGKAKPETSFDAVVVGAGPAGSAAAIALAREGRSVCLVERGPFPGSKNLFGGVIYPRVLDGLVPTWRSEAPFERVVTRRATMVLTDSQSLSVDFRSTAWGQEPYNGMTATRARFDSWLAGKAVEAGAVLLESTTVTGLLREARGGAVVGVRTDRPGGYRPGGDRPGGDRPGGDRPGGDRPGGEIEAGAVVACDGVNAFLAREAGCAGEPDSSHFTLGVKEVLALPSEEIERRFGLGEGEGADFEVLGGTGGVPGGGFIYTNHDTVSVGLVLSLPGLKSSGRRPEELLAGFKAHPAIAPLVAGGDIVEFGAHLIPEAGVEMMPRLAAGGFLVAGDAAGMCLAAGIFLEGVNFALSSGAAAGDAVVEALKKGDMSEAFLRRAYTKRLEEGFVLADLRKLRRLPHLVLSERAQAHYAEVACNVAEQLLTVANPVPKAGLIGLTRRELRRSKVKMRHVAADALTLLRSLG